MDPKDEQVREFHLAVYHEKVQAVYLNSIGASIFPYSGDSNSEFVLTSFSSSSSSS